MVERNHNGVTVGPVTLSPRTIDQGSPESNTQRRLLAYLALAGVVVMWAMGPPLSKLVLATPSTIVAVRMWMAVPLTQIAARLAGASFTRRSMKYSLPGGAFFGANMFLFFSALRHVSIATITLVGVLQPIIVTLVAARLFGERITRWWVAWTSVAIVGVAAAVLLAGKAVRATPFGLLLAISCTVCLAAYLVASREARRTLGAGEYLAGVMLWAAILLSIPLVFQGLHLNELDAKDWMLMGAILIGPGWIGHLLLNWAITEIPMSITSLQMLPSTVISVAVAWPVNNEPVTFAQAVAGLVTLVAVAMILHGPFRRAV